MWYCIRGQTSWKAMLTELESEIHPSSKTKFQPLDFPATERLTHLREPGDTIELGQCLYPPVIYLFLCGSRRLKKTKNDHWPAVNRSRCDCHEVRKWNECGMAIWLWVHRLVHRNILAMRWEFHKCHLCSQPSLKIRRLCQLKSIQFNRVAGPESETVF